MDASSSLTDSKLEKLLTLENCPTWRSTSAFGEAAKPSLYKWCRISGLTHSTKDTATGHKLLSSEDTEQNPHCRSSGCQLCLSLVLTWPSLSEFLSVPGWYCPEGLCWLCPVHSLWSARTSPLPLQLSHPPFWWHHEAENTTWGPFSQKRDILQPTYPHRKSMTSHKSFRTELENLYFHGTQTTVSLYLIIHLLLLFLVQEDLSTSCWERLPLQWERCCILSTEWGNGASLGRKGFQGGGKAMQELDASVITAGYSAEFALNVFLVMNHPKSCQKKKVVCPERNPSPLTLAFMLIWAQKVEREFSTPKCDKTENITFFGANKREKFKTVSWQLSQICPGQAASLAFLDYYFQSGKGWS